MKFAVSVQNRLKGHHLLGRYPSVADCPECVSFSKIALLKKVFFGVLATTKNGYRKKIMGEKETENKNTQRRKSDQL